MKILLFLAGRNAANKLSPVRFGGSLCCFMIFTLFFMNLSCANLVQVKVDVVDQRTALENQVLGSYESVDGDRMLLASVRSVNANGELVPTQPIPEGKKRAIYAMQRSLFNRDDIDQLKAIGGVGEGKDGYLRYFETPEISSDPKKVAFAKNLVSEENEDRKTLYQRIVEINKEFKDGDINKVATIMAGLNRDSAKKGEMIETDSGKWVMKK